MAEPAPSGYRVLMAPAQWPDGSLWFPNRLTAAFLAERKEALGVYLWACNYQQDPISQADRAFREDWWRCWDTLPPECDYYLLIDPAGDGITKTKSHTAVVEVAVPPPQHPYYLTRAERWTSTDADLLDQVFAWDRVHRYAAIGVEMVQLRGLIKTTMAVLEAQQRHPLLARVVELQPHGVKKERRIEQLAAPWARGEVLVAPSGMEALHEEFQRFPKGRYKDLLDALAYLDQVLHAPWEARRPDEEQAWLDAADAARAAVRVTTKGHSTGYR